ncbi:MAG: tetratricopeptide repeat protein [Ferruginibacter sp.]
MKKQLILAAAGLTLVIILFVFGKTETKKIKSETAMPQNAVPSFNISQFITEIKQKLTPAQTITLGKLENSVSRGDVKAQQINANNQLAAYWKDSVKAFEPYIYYLAAASKLDNSEKNLTFAAQLILDNLKGEQDLPKLNWEVENAIQLFEQALQLNPNNNDLKIGLGSCYIYGKGHLGKPEETMKGIQLLLSVVKEDSANMKAQLVLGVGGFVSGQYDKAIDRLQKVVAAQPGNMEAIAYLADTYASKGNKTEAVKWYTILKKVANNPAYSKQIEERIKMLQEGK